MINKVIKHLRAKIRGIKRKQKNMYETYYKTHHNMKILITDIAPGLRFILPAYRPNKQFSITDLSPHRPIMPNHAVLVQEVGKCGGLIGKKHMYPISWLLQDGVQ